MPPPPLRIVYLTAGAAGMYCGACLHDNTLVSALHRLGADVQLVPTYTPIRTDETDVSVDRVFFGGVNVYLQQRFAVFRYLPRLLDRWLDQPWLLRLATSRGIEIDPRELGAMTVSMLQGEHGYQRKEVRRLQRWLSAVAQPDLVALTNILIGGCIPSIKRVLGVPVVVTLQGDDAFLDYLPEPYRGQAFEEIRRLVRDVDGFVVNSRYYAEHMSQYLGVPPERIQQVPLGIDTRDFQHLPDGRGPRAETGGPVRKIGYLARLAPEKGLHVLVEAFILLRQRPDMQDVHLELAGWLGSHHQSFADQQFRRLHEAGLAGAYRYVGEVDRRGKLEFLAGLDVFSVPTTQREPKGLFVLEALAAGVPVVQPDHGDFPELLAATGGGWLTRPGDPQDLAARLAEVLNDPRQRAARGRAGREAVHRQFNAEQMARATLDVYRRFVPSPG